MNNNRIVTGAGILLLLAGCGSTPNIREFGGTPLPACAVADTPFEDVEFAAYEGEEKEPEYGKWRELYDKHLKEILKAEEAALLGSEEDSPASTLKCIEGTYVEMMPASQAVKDLAKELEAFKGRSDKLSSLDTTAVLLEWLRTYECALAHMSRNAEDIIREELRKKGEKDISNTRVSVEATRRKTYIASEGRSVRAVTGRLMTILGGLSRLRPLTAELTCLERASADIRNSMSLLAEAGACLPRALDIKASPRDFTVELEP